MKAVADERYIWSIVADRYCSLVLDGLRGGSGHDGDAHRAEAYGNLLPWCRTEVN